MNSNSCCQFRSNQSSSACTSSAQIRNRYLSKLGILPNDGPRSSSNSSSSPRILAATTAKVSTIMKRNSPRGGTLLRADNGIVGHHSHNSCSVDASDLLLGEETSRGKAALRTEDTTDVCRSLTSIFESASTCLVEEEIPEVSLKGLAFISSRESMMSFPNNIEDEDNSYYGDEKSFASTDDEDDYDDVKSFAADEDYADFGDDRSFATYEEEEEEEEEGDGDDQYHSYERLSYVPEHHEGPSVLGVVPQPTTEQEMPPQPRVVHFRNSVTVYEIPSHREYDEISRNSLWNSFQVQERNVRRNLLEFSADQSDWRQACEEDDMIPTTKGELVHPATWKVISERMAYLQNNIKEQVRNSNNNNQLLRRFAHQVFAVRF